MRHHQLDRLFREHQQHCYVAALAITRNRAAAEDAVHDALVAVCTADVEPRDLKAYLFRAVRNKALDSLRRARRTDPLPEDYLEIDGHDETAAVFAEQVRRFISQLETDQQQVLIMKLFAGLTHEEIANILSTSPNTVATWYRRGLSRLKELMHADR